MSGLRRGLGGDPDRAELRPHDNPSPRPLSEKAWHITCALNILALQGQAQAKQPPQYLRIFGIPVRTRGLPFIRRVAEVVLSRCLPNQDTDVSTLYPTIEAAELAPELLRDNVVEW